MKLFYLIFPLLLFAQLTISVESISDRYDFIKEKTLLLEICNDNISSEEQKVEALIELAEGYDKYAEYYQMSTTFYKKVLRKQLPDDSPFKLKAVSELERIETLVSEYKHLDKFLFNTKVVTGKKRSEKKVEKNILAIEKSIENNPDYHNINELKFFLAKEYMNLEKFSKAQILLQNILIEKPSIDLKIPISPILRDNYTKLIEQRKNDFIKLTLIILLISLIIIFYISRPWKWLNWKHIAAYFIIIALWYIAYKASLLLLARDFIFSNEITKKLNGEMPAYINSEVNMYALPLLKTFFNYSLVLITGVYLFSLGIYRSKFRKISIAANVVFTIILSYILSVVFISREMDHHGRYYLENENNINYLSGHYFFRVPDMEAYILTDPGSYPDLKGKSIKSENFKKWVDENIENPNFVIENNEKGE